MYFWGRRANPNAGAVYASVAAGAAVGHWAVGGTPVSQSSTRTAAAGRAAGSIRGRPDPPDVTRAANTEANTAALIAGPDAGGVE